MVPRQTAIPRKRRQAFNAKPRRGCKHPAQGKRAKRATPWVRQRGFRYAPGGGKSSDRSVQTRRREHEITDGDVQSPMKSLLSLLLPPPGAYRRTPGLTQGVASLRSLALGWELATPSGFSLNACLPYNQQTSNYCAYSQPAFNACCRTDTIPPRRRTKVAGHDTRPPFPHPSPAPAGRKKAGERCAAREK